MGGYSLQEKLEKMKTLIKDTLINFRLDEKDRINEISKMHLSGLERSITNAGHYFAMTNADAQISTLGAVNEITSGISYLKNLKSLRSKDGNVDSQKIINICKKIKEKILSKPITDVTVTSEEIAENTSYSISIKKSELEEIQGIIQVQNETAWLADTDINFCAQSFRSVGYRHPDAPTLTVLGSVLRNGFLHSAIREKGGAYGSGAIQDMSTKTFKFFSYRDPNIIKTFDAFNESINWALKSITKDKLEEGILNIISSIDKPSSPASEALSDYNSNFNGYTQKMRKDFRNKVLETSIDKLTEVTKKYLLTDCKRSVISNEKAQLKKESFCFIHD